MHCFGCFGADPHPEAAGPSPSDKKRTTSFRHRSTQVSDVTHLLGPAQPKQQHRFLAAIQAPQFGDHAYELIGDVGNTQNAGDMKLARHKCSKELVCIKCLKQSADVLLDKNVEREILNHRRLNHINILSFREVFATDSQLCIVVEHASAGSLADRCEGRRMAESQARHLYAQLLDGLGYCHAQGVYHRDLRVEHVLLSGSVYEPVVKISSFGYSKSATMDSMAKTMVGARGYMAPEVIISSGSYDASKTDVWAAGVILYQMLTGRLPFCHDSNASGILDRTMMQRIMRGQFLLPGNLELSLEAQDVLCSVFQPDPKKRIALAELRKHPWLTAGPSAALAQGTHMVERPMQTEEGISAVIQRARQRRLQRRMVSPAESPAGISLPSSSGHKSPGSLGGQSTHSRRWEE